MQPIIGACYQLHHCHRIEEYKSLAIGKHVEICHILIANPEISHQLTVLRKCEGKLDSIKKQQLSSRHLDLKMKSCWLQIIVYFHTI